jgi:hypothetical protein
MYSKKSNKPKKYVAGGILLAQLGLEAGKGLYGAYQAEQASRELGKLKTPATSVSEYEQLYKQSIDSDIQRRKEEQLAQQMATSLQALQGVRGGAQIPALTRMYGELGLREAEAAQARQMAALGQLAGAKERTLDRNIAQYERRRAELGAALEGGVQNIAGALGGGAQALGTYAGAQQTQKLIDALTATAGAADQKQIEIDGVGTLDQYLNSQPTAKVSQEPAIAPIIDKQGNVRSGSYMRAQEPVIKQLKALQNEKEAISQLTDEQYAALLRMKDLGIINFNTGGKMTKGAFNHKTNPIDIVQKGKKVGEMTGGEVILNPAQQKKLSQESAYFRSLLKKFNKQK